MSTLKVNSIQHSNGTAALNIDSSGRVTMAQNISFKAYGTAGDISYGSSNTTVIWSTTQHNLGNCYNNSTGRFTAPVAGTYHFGFHAYRQATSAITRQYIAANSNAPAYLIFAPNASYPFSLNLHCTVYLNVNDYVYCQLQAEAATNFYFADNHSFFYGFLVG
jgi:hypothetical protein